MEAVLTIPPTLETAETADARAGMPEGPSDNAGMWSYMVASEVCG